MENGEGVRMPLSVTVTARVGHAVVTPVGDLEYGNAPLLTEHLTQVIGEAISAARSTVIIDMSGVDLCDSSGLTVFVRAINQARAADVTLLVSGLTDRVHSVFTVTGLDTAVPIHPDLDTAITSLQQPVGDDAPDPPYVPGQPSPPAGP
jgi:anti-sigma B factor antagonist